jgi:hypothetical protein
VLKAEMQLCELCTSAAAYKWLRTPTTCCDVLSAGLLCYVCLQWWSVRKASKQLPVKVPRSREVSWRHGHASDMTHGTWTMLLVLLDSTPTRIVPQVWNPQLETCRAVLCSMCPSHPSPAHTGYAAASGCCCLA